MPVQIVEEVPSSAESRQAGRYRLRLENILVPTDFSERSMKAVMYGAALAEQFGATLWLLHIVEPAPSFIGTEAVPFDLGVSVEKLREAELRMTDFAARHVPATVPVSSIVRDGTAVEEISNFAKRQNVDLLVITTHGRVGVTRAVFGSEAERIIHHAPCPILIVREDEHEFVREGAGGGAKAIDINRILVALDLTDCSTKALRYGVTLAHRFGAAVHCLHVLPTEKPMLIVETEGYHKAQRLEAERKLEARIHETDGSVSMRSEIRAGAVDQEIIDTATEEESDLIIVGEHRRSAFGRFLLGDTTDAVVRRAHCPVLVVREVEHEFIE